jgi:exopolysaccharide biosynthesis WecB/TagA/CpsF family protein
LNIYYKNKDYGQLLDTKFDVYQADLGVYLALRFLYNKKINRIIGTDLNEMLLNELFKQKVSITLIGGNFDEKFIFEEAKKKGIILNIYKNGYFTDSMTDEVINYLKEKNSQVYIVGMGVPRQEIFAHRLAETLDKRVIICVGSFLEFYFGTKTRTPVFIQKIGFEWMFRMMSEPARLWKRYLIGIPVFVLRIFKIKFQWQRK